MCNILFFFNDTATTEIYTLSLHDALPIWLRQPLPARARLRGRRLAVGVDRLRQLHVARGDAAGVVAPERQRHFRVMDRDVGVVLLALGQLTHAIDEGERRAEIGDAVRLLERAARPAPARQARQRGAERGLVQRPRVLRHVLMNFCSDRISRGGFSFLPAAVPDTSAT